MSHQVMSLAYRDFLALLGQKIKDLRLSYFFTQESLCTGLCCPTHLSKLENGKLMKEDPCLLIALSSRLHVPYPDLVASVYYQLVA